MNMAGSLAQRVITNFTCLEFYVQAGAIWKVSQLNKSGNLNVTYPSGSYYNSLWNSPSHYYRWIRVAKQKDENEDYQG